MTNTSAASSRRVDTIALRKLMIDKGFKNVTQLSEAADVNRVTLGKLLDGQIQPSAETMAKLVKALDIPPADAGQIFFALDLPIE